MLIEVSISVSSHSGGGQLLHTHQLFSVNFYIILTKIVLNTDYSGTPLIACVDSEKF